MKNVIIITSTFTNEKKGGVPSYVENRAEYLSKKLNVSVFGLGKNQKSKNVIYKSFGDSSKFKYLFFFYWIKLVLLCFKHRKSLIEIHNIPVAFPIFFIFKTRYFFHGPSRLEAKIENKTLIEQRFNYFIEKICLKLSYKIFVVSKHFRKVLIKEHNLKNRRICLNLPKYKFKKSYFHEKKSNNKNLNFFIVRRLVKRTGVVPFVKLFLKMIELKDIPQNSKLIVAGEGPEKKNLIYLIDNSNYKKNVEYLGLISEEKKIELYKKSDYNVVPTIKLEGFGLVIIEAGICGCMSIVTNVDAMPEVIGYLDNQGLIYELNESSVFNTFKLLKKDLYDKKNLHLVTKKKFFFD